jgi:gamma-glutamyl-gamma-aminobutyrate hydrolase PuuD
MSIVALTMRRDEVPHRAETRDALESSWWEFLGLLGHTPLLLPNHPEQAERLMTVVNPSAAIMTGGGEVGQVAAKGPRDAVETMLFDRAVRTRTPLIGICRGMQAIALRSGAQLKDIPAHVRRQGELRTRFGLHQTHCYHHQAVDRVPDDFLALGVTTGGDIEAIEHRRLPIVGVMWHPERTPAFDDADVHLFRQALGA